MKTPFKFSLGQLVWIRNGEDCEQFEIEDMQIINTHPCYLVDGWWTHENLLKS